MSLYNELPEDLTEVDIIIAGGGTAGCIVAGRLAAAEPTLTILVIEGGTNNRDFPSVVVPLFFTNNLKPLTKSAIFYPSNKSKQLANRELIVPSGGILGGGSSINFMMYTRAQRSDYDSWKTPGWSADELWPYLKKLETYHGSGDAAHHGFNGPVHVSDGAWRVGSTEDDFLQAAQTVGYPEVPDLQNLDSNNGFQRWLRYVSPRGERQDTAHTYIHPLLEDGQHPNLHVLVEHQVIRVLFDDEKRACGVEFSPNATHQLVAEGKKQTVKARKLVVVSCGGCGSPSVLERSGVGNPSVLQKAGVAVVAAVPGVGHDYQDHNLTINTYRTSLRPEDTADAYLSQRLPADDMVEKQHPMLGWNGIDIGSKLRPTDAAIAALGREFQAAWDKDYRLDPNRPLMLTALLAGYFGDFTLVPPTQYVSIANYSAYPYSRGHIHITGPSLSDRLDFDVGFFTDKDGFDVKMLIWAYKNAREILRRTTFYRGEVAQGHPRFPEGSKAACVEVEERLFQADRAEVEDLEYTAEDDQAIEQFMRESVETTWHSLGTCKMAPRAEMGVVDKDLNVYGVRGLKVVDLSIVPENVGANTNNTALVIGEKGADIIAEELGIFLSSGPLKG
ncbi:GMC oxidoreductase-domain-containing protein [Lasiosphaeris hirsuta]|uniref:GMC oxidoreductase-domain-containing protein n=1 Tax=Lasiosphaeris hirsuta TaxID=260670 RepID=A0AA40E2F8_9PEZI|nr:GMC oxidoreductase-domain-containing protein [Lasiosphaeris hirsuta]